MKIRKLVHTTGSPYLTEMKCKKGLVFALLCFLPGLYAVIAWTIHDLKNNYRNWSDEQAGMNRLLPFFSFSIQSKMLVLLLLSLCGLVMVIKSAPKQTTLYRKTRIFLLILGIILVLALSFPFM